VSVIVSVFCSFAGSVAVSVVCSFVGSSVGSVGCSFVDPVDSVVGSFGGSVSSSVGSVVNRIFHTLFLVLQEANQREGGKTKDSVTTGLFCNPIWCCKLASENYVSGL